MHLLVFSNKAIQGSSPLCPNYYIVNKICFFQKKGKKTTDLTKYATFLMATLLPRMQQTYIIGHMLELMMQPIALSSVLLACWIFHYLSTVLQFLAFQEVQITKGESISLR